MQGAKAVTQFVLVHRTKLSMASIFTGPPRFHLMQCPIIHVRARVKGTIDTDFGGSTKDPNH